MIPYMDPVGLGFMLVLGGCSSWCERKGAMNRAGGIDQIMIGSDVELTSRYRSAHLSSDQNPGCLGYIGDEILPSYMGIIISHYKDPYQPTRIQWNVNRVFNVAHLR